MIFILLLILFLEVEVPIILGIYILLCTHSGDLEILFATMTKALFPEY